MSGDARDLLPEYVLGLLSDEERRRFAAESADSAPLNRDVRLAAEAIATLSDALPPRPVAVDGRARLMATLASPDRFAAFFPTLRQWYDLDDDGLRAVIARMDAGQGCIHE